MVGIVQRPHHDRRKAKNGANREVEFARRHDHRHAQRDNAQFRRERQEVADVIGREEGWPERGENNHLQDKQYKRPKLWPGDKFLKDNTRPDWLRFKLRFVLNVYHFVFENYRDEAGEWASLIP